MKKLIRIAILVGVFLLIFIALISNSVKPANLSEKVINSAMTLGDPETAVRHYIVYTDLMCPYCNYYAKSVADNEEEFEAFLAKNKILYEVRVTDMLYEGSGVEMSRPAAEGAYCAARENKFWDYYHLALSTIFADYYERGLGNSKTAPQIPDMTRDYWLKIGEKAGLSEDFNSCFNERLTVSEIQDNTYKASYTASGLPYFVFGSFTTGGYDSSWDWGITKQMLEMGL